MINSVPTFILFQLRILHIFIFFTETVSNYEKLEWP